MSRVPHSRQLTLPGTPLQLTVSGCELRTADSAVEHMQSEDMLMNNSGHRTPSPTHRDDAIHTRYVTYHTPPPLQPQFPSACWYSQCPTPIQLLRYLTRHLLSVLFTPLGPSVQRRAERRLNGDRTWAVLGGTKERPLYPEVARHLTGCLYGARASLYLYRPQWWWQVSRWRV